MYQAAHEADKGIIAFSPLAQMALNWILKDDALTSVLIGASSPAQIIENTTKIRRHAFTEEELQKIDRIVF